MAVVFFENKSDVLYSRCCGHVNIIHPKEKVWQQNEGNPPNRLMRNGSVSRFTFHSQRKKKLKKPDSKSHQRGVLVLIFGMRQLNIVDE